MLVEVKNNTKNLVAGSVIAGAIGLAIAALMGNISIFFFSILSWLLIDIVDCAVFKGRKKNANILLLIWIVNIVCILWMYYAQIRNYGFPYIMSDDYYMETEWVKECLDKDFYTISQMIEGSQFFRLANCNAYILFFAYLNRIASVLGGYHTIDGRIINITATIICGLLVSGICEKNFLNTIKSRRKILVLTTVFPNIIYISVHIYRDCYIMLLLVFLFYIWNDRDIRKKPIVLLTLTTITLYLLYWNRAFSVVYGAIIIIIELFFVDFNKKLLDKKYSKLQVVCVLGGVVAVFIFAIYMLQLPRFARYLSLYNGINTEDGGLKRLVYGMDLLPVGWLFRIGFFLCSPFYPQIVGDLQFGNSLDIIYILVTMGTCFLFFLYPYLLKGILRFNSLGIIFLVMFCSTAIITSGFRHIMACYPFMFIMCGYEYEKTDFSRRGKYIGYSGILFLLYFTVYFVSKVIM